MKKNKETSSKQKVYMRKMLSLHSLIHKVILGSWLSQDIASGF